MYVIVNGKVRISKTVRGVEKVITTLPSGEFFGEMALLNHRPRSATATIIDDAELIVVRPTEFDGLIYHNREVALRLVRRLARRLEDATDEITLLLYRDPASRVAHALRHYAAGRGHHRGDGLHIAIGPGELAERLGLRAHELADVVDRFIESGLISGLDDDHIVIADRAKLDRLLEFLELSHEFAAIRPTF